MGVIRRRLMDWLGKTVEDSDISPAAAEEVGRAAEACCWMEVARAVAASYYIAALSRCEIRFKPDGKRAERDRSAWLWNVSPNPDQSHAEMMAQVLSQMLMGERGAALVVPVARGRAGAQLWAADGWVEVERPGREDLFENVSIQGSTEVCRRSLRSSEVYLFSVARDSGWAALMAELDKQYGALAASALSAMGERNADRWLVSIDAPLVGSEAQKQAVDEYLRESVKQFVKSRSAILPVYRGQSVSRVSTDATKRSGDPAAEVVSIRKDMFETAAECLRIPAALLMGNTNNFESLVDSFLTFGVDHMARVLSDELTRKTYSMEQWASGARVEVDTSRIRHVDVFSVADKAEKLVGGSIDSPNEIRALTGQQPIDEPWADEYLMTKNNALRAAAE